MSLVGLREVANRYLHHRGIINKQFSNLQLYRQKKKFYHFQGFFSRCFCPFFTLRICAFNFVFFFLLFVRYAKSFNIPLLLFAVRVTTLYDREKNLVFLISTSMVIRSWSDGEWITKEGCGVKIFFCLIFARTFGIFFSSFFFVRSVLLEWKFSNYRQSFTYLYYRCIFQVVYKHFSRIKVLKITCKELLTLFYYY